MEGCIGFGFAAIAFSAGVSTGVRGYHNRAYGLIWCLGKQTQLAARSFVRSFVYRKVYSISSPEQYSPTRTAPFKIRSMIFPEQSLSIGGTHAFNWEQLPFFSKRRDCWICLLQLASHHSQAVFGFGHSLRARWSVQHAL
jgi:hypothetical protein